MTNSHTIGSAPSVRTLAFGAGGNERPTLRSEPRYPPGHDCYSREIRRTDAGRRAALPHSSPPGGSGGGGPLFSRGVPCTSHIQPRSFLARHSASSIWPSLTPSLALTVTCPPHWRACTSRSPLGTFCLASVYLPGAAPPAAALVRAVTRSPRAANERARSVSVTARLACSRAHATASFAPCRHRIRARSPLERAAANLSSSRFTSLTYVASILAFCT